MISKYASQHYSSNKAWMILPIIIVLKLLANYLLIHPSYELHRDEFLHLDQARHLSWGYLSVPPLTSWISVIINWLGNSEFWVKFFPALFGALTIVAGWMIADLLNGKLFAKSLTAIALFFSVLLRINILYQPNSFYILSWTLVYLFFCRYIKTEEPKWLYMMALAFAMGLLNKYSILFLGLSLGAGILLTDSRKIFSRKHFWFACVLALALVMANLLWQLKNNFPFIHHMKELVETQLINVNRADFVKEQILFFLNSIYLLIAAMVGFARFPAFKKYRAVIISYIICILLFIYFKAKGYYAIGLYPVLIAFGAVFLEHLVTGRKLLKPLSFVIIFLLFLPLLIAFPVLKPTEIVNKEGLYKGLGLLRWEDGKDHQLPQDFADMLGWKEMALKTDSIIKTLPGNEYTVIRTDNYGQAGAINYYAGLNAVSYNADYLYWFDFSRKIDNLVLVKEVTDSDPALNDEKPYFDTIYQAALINNPHAREFGTRIYVLKKAKVELEPILKKEINEIINR